MDNAPLCLLALDGGGIRGLSELVVLEEIMNRIRIDLREDKDPIPARFFDLIGGTSTGGLIALLLGRLRMSVPQARKEYVRIAEEVFSIPSAKNFRFLKKHAFDGRKLERAVKGLLETNGGDESMLEHEGLCKVFVCAVPQSDVRARAGPRLFRTYPVRENASFNCKIWEACRATSAAPTYFEPIQIGDDGEKETFVDGGLGYNNPVEQVLEEARRIFPGRKVACVVSIGTGTTRIIEFPDSPKRNAYKVIKALKKMATESETTAEKMNRRFAATKGIYFRFNVDRGLEGVGLEEWEYLSAVRTHTTEYLRQDAISGQISAVVEAILAAKDVSQGHSTAVIRLRNSTAGDEQSSQGVPEWRREGRSLSTFHYTTDHLALHIVGQVARGHWIVPFDRNPDFVGRSGELDVILSKIPPRARRDMCQGTVLEGLGGIGKTQIALEAAYRVRDAHPECSVFWVPAVDAAAFENAYRQIGQKLDVPGMKDDNANVKELVKDALSRSGDDWLLVIDSVDDTALFGETPLWDYLPSNHNGSILFTTRTHDVASELDIRPRDVVRVSEMSRPETIKLMRNYLDPEQMSDDACLKELLDLLADLPLAVKQASAYMGRQGMTTTQYLQYCRSSDTDLLSLLSEGFEDRGRYKNAASTRNPVATTWFISFSQLSELGSRLLKYMSLLAREDIPRSILPLGHTELEMDEAIGELRGCAFITQRASEESYDLHRLVRLATRNWLGQKEKLEDSARLALQRLHDIFPKPEHDNKEMWVRYLPHAMEVLTWHDSLAKDMVESTVLARAAKGNYMLGRIESAKELYEKLLNLRTRFFGEKNVDTLASMGNLATAHRGLGQYKMAEDMFRRTLELSQETLGGRHRVTLHAMNGLGIVLVRLGRYKESEEMHREALRLQREVLGNKDPETLESMDNLGVTLTRLGGDHMGEAEELHRQALELRREVLGLTNPQTLSSLSNHATALLNVGRNLQAEARARVALDMRRKVLGDAHPATLETMNNLAVLHHRRGRYKEAEAGHRETLALLQEKQGHSHPSTIMSMNNLGAALAGLGKYEEAEAMHREALALRREVFGDDHPHTIETSKNLALIRQWKEASGG
ncbi:COM1 regulatory protein [Purpureocillium lavendulum]|uniref:COM1 regulatory protein n=1 Tax=Purpureocillium lavendulum TaxID=1247861 RepID=A0AB34FWK4_9HYPO|nr:COM1 regulatory protein [Purpureocillium lavendulum]